MPAGPSQPRPAASRQLSARGPQASVARARSTPTARSGTSTRARRVKEKRVIAAPRRASSHQAVLNTVISRTFGVARLMAMAEAMARVGDLELCYEQFGDP